MSYTDVFGGATIYPSGQSYLSLQFSTDQTLAWPIEQQVDGNVVANIMDLDATGAGLNVDIPDARQVAQGIQSVFNNVGSNSITIRDATGGTIISLGSGEAWVAYLTDNTTEAGTWRTFQLGASVSVANASALAGAGLKAISSTLNQRIAPTSTAVTPITWADSDRAQFTIWTGGVGVLNLPAPGTVGSDWFAMVRNSGSGDLTLTPPSGTIDGSATLAMASGESAIVVTDGTNFFTVGYGQSTSSVFDFIEINVAGSGDYTLSGVELNRISYRFTGTLTGNRNIIVPGSVQQYWVDNSTSGAFSLFVKTAAQITPIEVLQGDRNILYCDGTDVVGAESSTVTFPIAVAQGGTGANTAANARVNLAVPPETRIITAGQGLIGGGDLSSDRTLNVGAGTGITVNADDIAVDVATLEPLLTIANLGGYDANDNVDHTAVSLLAGTGISGTGLGDLSASRTINALVASESQQGVLELATSAEVLAATDDARAITPLKLTEKYIYAEVEGGAFQSTTTFAGIDFFFNGGLVSDIPLTTGKWIFRLHLQHDSSSGGQTLELRLNTSDTLSFTHEFCYKGVDLTTGAFGSTGYQALSGVPTTAIASVQASGSDMQFIIEGRISVTVAGNLTLEGRPTVSTVNFLRWRAAHLELIKVDD